ncbi:MAG: sigma-70 family RNA polymerase sigma factor [Actinobacteria bacterium]|nr:sigma-70 family RNA polymerase sigma factor [Actinomycetota bacterium]
MSSGEERTDPVSESHERGGELLQGVAGAALAEAAGAARAADEGLAGALGRTPPHSAVTSSAYLDELGRRGRLTTDSERNLVLAAQDGDRDARARLVEAFMPLIASVARNYRQTVRVERIELLQEGVVGLLRALERFDPKVGTPFWAYASWWVRQAMQQLVAELTRPTVLSDRALRRLSRVREAYEEGLRSSGREPGRDELAASAGISRQQVDDLLAVDAGSRSLEATLGSGEEGRIGTLGDLIADPLAEGEFELVLEAMEVKELLSLLAGLSERERSILRARFGLEGTPEESRRQLAERLGVSAERVRQIEERALRKLAAAAGE